MILTSNLALIQWVGAFADDSTRTSAMLDRLLDPAYIGQTSGERYRLRNKRKASNQLQWHRLCLNELKGSICSDVSGAKGHF